MLDSNNNINLFYMNKDLDNDYLYNNNDEALNYVNKLEQSVNEKSILNAKNCIDASYMFYKCDLSNVNFSFYKSKRLYLEYFSSIFSIFSK